MDNFRYSLGSVAAWISERLHVRKFYSHTSSDSTGGAYPKHHSGAPDRNLENHHTVSSGGHSRVELSAAGAFT